MKVTNNYVDGLLMLWRLQVINNEQLRSKKDLKQDASHEEERHVKVNDQACYVNQGGDKGS